MDSGISGVWASMGSLVNTFSKIRDTFVFNPFSNVTSLELNLILTGFKPNCVAVTFTEPNSNKDFIATRLIPTSISKYKLLVEFGFQLL